MSSAPGAAPAARRPALVLASRSPQRRAILDQLGIGHLVRPADVDEELAGAPEAAAGRNALRKALAVARPGELVLGVDTVVALDERAYGKPADEADARVILRALAGREHEVVSGLALVRDGEARRAIAVTRVTFRALDDVTLDWYLGTGEWRERAGGYAIQGRGAGLVRRVDGDYLNVVGLPVAALLDLEPSLLINAA